MFCNHCGTALPDDSRFCLRCGNGLAAAAVATPITTGTGAAAAPAPLRTETNWKRIFLRAAGVGAGLGLGLAAILGVALWYGSRPKPPKPWDTKTIQAGYDDAGDGATERNTSDIGLWYFLKNNGLEDYRIGDSDSVQLSVTSNDGALAPFNRFASIETPIFVPAGHKTSVFMKLKTVGQFQNRLPQHPTDAQEEQYRKDALDYLNGTQITGFALFDEAHRIEIDFPSGWKKPESQKKTAPGEIR